VTYPYQPVPGPADPASGAWAPAGYGSAYGAYGAGRPPVRRVPNPVGIAIALVGGIAALVGVFVDWYTDVQLGDIVNGLDADGAKAFPKAYFGWLMWVLLAATVVAALLANLPVGVAGALRVISPILGVLGAVLVIVSLHELIRGASVFDHSAGGLYLVLVGFVVSGAGGVPGPRRAVGYS
jgi:hypothetical protein